MTTGMKVCVGILAVLVALAWNAGAYSQNDYEWRSEDHRFAPGRARNYDHERKYHDDMGALSRWHRGE